MPAPPGCCLLVKGLQIFLMCSRIILYLCPFPGVTFWAVHCGNMGKVKDSSFMKAVVQRTTRAEVRINDKVSGAIGLGLVVLVGIMDEDTEEDVRWLSRKISMMRIFEDEQGKMNRSVKDVDGRILMVSQFTLHALTRKGNRPSFIRAAGPGVAIPLYEAFKKQLETDTGGAVESGEFGAYMEVDLVNDGPVTIIMDSKNKE